MLKMINVIGTIVNNILSLQNISDMPYYSRGYSVIRDILVVKDGKIWV